VELMMASEIQTEKKDISSKRRRRRRKFDEFIISTRH
jgi:hypothetical protein